MTSVAEAPVLAGVAPTELRRAMGRFTTGVAVVLSETPDGPHGATVNSITWVSLDPPLVLISLARLSRIATVVRTAQAYSVSILGSRQARIASEFAKPGAGKLDALPIHRGSTGLPIVPGALATLECTVEKEVEAGDHVVLIGRVHHVTHRKGEPLAFYSGRFGDFIDPDGELDIWL